MDWLLSPTNYMSELVPAKKNGANGRTLEIMTPKSSAYIHMNLSALQKLDSMLIVIRRECVYYYHDMIVQMDKCGFQEGKTLFRFGYDFRRSNRTYGAFKCYFQEQNRKEESSLSSDIQMETDCNRCSLFSGWRLPVCVRCVWKVL